MGRDRQQILIRILSVISVTLFIMQHVRTPLDWAMYLPAALSLIYIYLKNDLQITQNIFIHVLINGGTRLISVIMNSIFS